MRRDADLERRRDFAARRELVRQARERGPSCSFAEGLALSRAAERFHGIALPAKHRGPVTLDPTALLRLLARSGIDYVLMGGWAVNTHGHHRATSDVDICPAPNSANLERLRDLARHGHAIDTMLDVHDEIAGLTERHTYASLTADAVLVEFDELRVQVCGLRVLLDTRRALPGWQPAFDVRMLEP